MLVPAVFLVFRKMNLCLWDTIIASLEGSASRHGSTSFMLEGLQVRAAVTYQANHDELVRGVGYFFGAV
jgi:hypothetical protein